MNHLLLHFILVLFPSFGDPCASSQPYDSLLCVLDKEIEKADYYIGIRQERIDSAKQVFYSAPTDYKAAFAVGKLYIPYMCDSAIAWMDMAERMCKGLLSAEEQLDYRRCVGRRDGYDVPFPYDTHEEEHSYHEHVIFTCLQGMALLEEGGDTAQAIVYLAEATIGDIRLGVTDNGASWRLAEVLAEQGGVNTMRAYTYMEYSSRNEIIFNSRLRYAQIGPVSYAMAKNFREMVKAEFMMLQKTMLVIVVFACLLILALVVIYNRVRKLRRLNKQMAAINEALDQSNKELDQANKELDKTNKELDLSNKQLAEMNQIREHYICAFLEEKSAAIMKQYKESVKAGDPNAEDKLKERLEDFYRSFDTTFLRLYPHFVEQINSLLRLDSQINPPKGCLTPELRIFGLIRLGIDKSTRIAELLCLSPNTVYNYRSRVKNMAEGDREAFEDKVRKL